MNARTFIGTGACALVLAGLGLGFSEIGPPSLNRSRAVDARLQQAISDIARSTGRTADVPPDVRAKITYEPESTTTYRLCTTFLTDGNQFSAYGSDATTWKHPAGRYCYRFARHRDRVATTSTPL